MIFLLPGCAAPPAKSLTKAQNAFLSAKAGGAPSNCPELYRAMEMLMDRARVLYDAHRFSEADADARNVVLLSEQAANCRPPAQAPVRIRTEAALEPRGISAVFFDTGLDSIRFDMETRIEQAAGELMRRPEALVVLEGHCDERGGDGQNFLLGLRRAQSVKSRLVDLGVSSSRIVTASYGASMPEAQGSDEGSWARNRRVEFRVVR